MTPVELLDDHQRRPRNLGKLMGASAVGDVGSIVAGDALRFYLLVDGGRITQARFQVFNCQSQLGASSAVSELVVGRTLAEAAACDHAAVAAHLGGLDHVFLPPQLWAVAALRSAIAALEGRETTFDDEREALLCRCHGVPWEQVRQAVTIGGCATVEAVGTATGAGTGCGSCQADIAKVIAGTDAPKPAAKAAAAKPVAGRIALLQRIHALVDEAVLGQLRAAGGDLELWDLDGSLLRVKAMGRLASDEGFRSEQLARLERLLRERIDPALGVALA
jgi:NifU-like protein